MTKKYIKMPISVEALKNEDIARRQGNEHRREKRVA